jgi:hypothetical protein
VLEPVDGGLRDGLVLHQEPLDVLAERVGRQRTVIPGCDPVVRQQRVQVDLADVHVLAALRRQFREHLVHSRGLTSPQWDTDDQQFLCRVAVHQVHLQRRALAFELVLGRRVEVELDQVVTHPGQGDVGRAGLDVAFLGLLVVPRGAPCRAVGILTDVLQLDVRVAVGHVQLRQVRVEPDRAGRDVDRALPRQRGLGGRAGERDHTKGNRQGDQDGDNFSSCHMRDLAAENRLYTPSFVGYRT